jgi:hypothetical protein
MRDRQRERDKINQISRRYHKFVDRKTEGNKKKEKTDGKTKKKETKT